MQKTVEEPQQGSVCVLVEHPPVIQRPGALSGHLAPDPVDQGVEVAQQGRNLQEEEDDPDGPSGEGRATDGGVVVVHYVPEQVILCDFVGLKTK